MPFYNTEDSFIAYLKFKQTHWLNLLNQYPEKKKELASKISELIYILERGMCVGFAIAERIMFILGQKEWWMYVIYSITQWDGEEDSLGKELKLPESVKTPQYETLDKIFETALQYVICCHYSLVENFENLEVLSGSNHLHGVRSIKKIGGTFTQEQLEEIVSAELIAGRVCFFSNFKHVMSIGYGEGYWWVYENNFNHKPPEDISYRARNKKESIRNITQALSTTVTLCMVSFHRENIDVPFYDSLLKNHPMELFKNRGWLQVAYAQPQVFEELIASLNFASKKDRQVINLLLDELASAVDGPSKIALFQICLSAPTAIYLFLDKIQHNKSLLKKFLTAVNEVLLEKDAVEWTGLLIMVVLAPIFFLKLLKILDKNIFSELENEIFLKILQGLSISNKKGLYPLKTLVVKHPGIALKLFEIVENVKNKKATGCFFDRKVALRKEKMLGMFRKTVGVACVEHKSITAAISKNQQLNEIAKSLLLPVKEPQVNEEKKDSVRFNGWMAQ